MNAESEMRKLVHSTITKDTLFTNAEKNKTSMLHKKPLRKSILYFIHVTITKTVVMLFLTIEN